MEGESVRPAIIVIFLLTGVAAGDERPLPPQWDYAAAMKEVQAKFHGR